jgi:hypothetical protein
VLALLLVFDARGKRFPTRRRSQGLSSLNANFLPELLSASPFGLAEAGPTIPLRLSQQNDSI